MIKKLILTIIIAGVMLASGCGERYEGNEKDWSDEQASSKDVFPHPEDYLLLDFDNDGIDDSEDDDDDNDGIPDTEDDCPLDPLNMCNDAQPDDDDFKSDTLHLNGYCGDPNRGSEDSEVIFNVDLEDEIGRIIDVYQIVFTLTWIEEPENSSSGEDTFNLTVDGLGYYDEISGNCNELNISFGPRNDPYDKDIPTSWTITVGIMDCGTDYGMGSIGVMGLLLYSDIGNSFELLINYVYTEK